MRGITLHLLHDPFSVKVYIDLATLGIFGFLLW